VNWPFCHHNLKRWPLAIGVPVVWGEWLVAKYAKAGFVGFVGMRDLEAEVAPTTAMLIRAALT
jgi:hypothetical protein